MIKLVYPTLIIVTTIVILALAIQLWLTWWAPLLLLVVVVGMGAAGGYYANTKYTAERGAPLIEAEELPGLGIGLFISVLIAATWAIPHARAMIASAAAPGGASSLEPILQDSNDLVRQRACAALVRSGAALHSRPLARSFEREPDDARRCFKELSEEGFGVPDPLIKRLTQRWQGQMLEAVTPDEAARACSVAPVMHNTQHAANRLLDGYSAELFECAMVAPSAQVRTCCVKVLEQTIPATESEMSVALFEGNIHEMTYPRLARAVYDSDATSPDHQVLGALMKERRGELIVLGCDMVSANESSVNDSGLRGLLYVVEQLDCQRHNDSAGGMSYLASPAPWADICDGVLEGDAPIEQLLCEQVERAWVESATIAAKVAVGSAQHGAAYTHQAGMIARAEEVRGYGGSGGTSQRDRYMKDLERSVRSGGYGQMRLRSIYKAMGYGGHDPGCEELDMGGRFRSGALKELINEEGLGCQRNVTIDELLHKRRDLLNSLNGKGPNNLVDQEKLRKKLGGNAFDAAVNDMKSAYNKDAKRKGMKQMR